MSLHLHGFTDSDPLPMMHAWQHDVQLIGLASLAFALAGMALFKLYLDSSPYRPLP